MNTGTSNKKSFLFVNSNGPNHVHNRDRSVKTKIRRHIMVDIGRARRKPTRNPTFDTELYLSRDDERGNVKNDSQDIHTVTRHSVSSMSTAPLEVVNSAPRFWNQHPLVLLEAQCGMDMFSAYGIILVIQESKNITGSDDFVDTFWFPFAFEQSAFLQQIQTVILSHRKSTGRYLESHSEFKNKALERALGTIACIESGLASRSRQIATSDALIGGVLAMICYNFVNFDFDQASVHLQGLKALMEARGGVSSFESNNDLRHKIFSVDVTASLLYHRRPWFPAPLDVARAGPSTHLEILPAPLHNIFAAFPIENASARHIFSSMTDLNTLTGRIEDAIATRCENPFRDKLKIGLIVDPIAHRLLDSPYETRVPFDLEPILEALWVGAILWTILIKRRYRSYPGPCTEYILKLVGLLAMEDPWKRLPGGPDLMSIRLWLMVISGISANQGSEAWSSTVNMLVSEMQHTNIQWNNVIGQARRMPWIRGFDVLCGGLQRAIDAKF